MEIDGGSGADLLSKQNNVFFGKGSLMKITENKFAAPNIHVPKRVIADKTKMFTNEFASRLEKLFFSTSRNTTKLISQTHTKSGC